MVGRQEREGDLSKVYPAAPPLPWPSLESGSAGLNEGPGGIAATLLPQRDVETGRGGRKRHRGVLACIGLSCCFAGAASWESSTSHRNDGGLVCFISSLVSLTLCSIIPPPTSLLLPLLHQIPFRALIMTFNNTEACGTSSVNTITL